MKQPENKSLKDRVLNSLEKIRPYLVDDGGDCELVDIKDNSVVNVRLLGSCGECQYMEQTMAGVSEAIMKESPEILQVNNVS